MHSVVHVAEGLELIRLSTWVSSALSYCTYVPLLDGLLLDSGFVNAADDLRLALRNRRVEQVANTHADEDHIGNNAWLVEERSVLLHAPKDALPALAAADHIPRGVYRRLVWGTPSGSRALPLGDEVRTGRRRLLVVPTPGHCPAHVAFFEPERGWLFTGDLFLGFKVRLARENENVADLVASLRRVLALSPKVLCCYHRGVVRAASEALVAKAAWLEGQRVAALRLRDEGLGVDAIGLRLFGVEPLTYRLLTAGDYTQANFVRALLAEPTPASAGAGGRG